MRRQVWIALFAVPLITAGGCYNYHIERCALQPGTDGQTCKRASDPSTDWESRTVHALAWGLWNKPQYFFTTVCPEQIAIDQVQVDDNLGFAAVTVLTAGFWSPKRLRYKCAKPLEGTDSTVRTGESSTSENDGWNGSVRVTESTSAVRGEEAAWPPTY